MMEGRQLGTGKEREDETEKVTRRLIARKQARTRENGQRKRGPDHPSKQEQEREMQGQKQGETERT